MNRAPRPRLRGAWLLAVGLLAACTAFHSWEDDHIVLNEMQLLEPNELWFEVLDQPAEPIECSFALCQNLLRSKWFEVTGDFERAKEMARAEIGERWAPIEDDGPLSNSDSILYQLRDDVEITTTTGTAYLRLDFSEDFEFRSVAVDKLITVTVSSDLPL